MIYRRHRAHCRLRRRGRRAWSCDCPIWFDARIGGKRILKSMNMTGWQEAQELAGQWEKQGPAGGNCEPAALTQRQQDISLEHAWENFLARAKTRNLRPATIYKYELLSRQMKAFGGRHGIHSLRDFTLDVLEQFQAGWKEGSAISRDKKLERLKAFFRAAHIRHWVDEDPAAPMQGPKAILRPTLPFTREEMARILAATTAYPDKSGKLGRPNAIRLRAFCLLLRFSGVRIGDAVSLRPEMLDGNKLFLYTSKTGAPVHLILPEFVTEALRTMPRLSERYLFWTGNSTLHTAIGIWQRSLRSLFRLARVENGYAHRFRDTFSVELLLSGVPIEQVSVLLGHGSSRVTSAHYNPWVRSRQEQLNRDLQRAWSQDPLVLLEERVTEQLQCDPEQVN